MKNYNQFYSCKTSFKTILTCCFLAVCHFSFSQIVINEISVKPNPDAVDACVQSLKNCSSTTCGSEYVEFYNNSDCPVDMSCYIFVTESFDGARDGSFRFPSGSVIPARGFISVGGPNSGATINLATYCSNNHMLTNNTRWYLDNGDAWVALYNSTGTLIGLLMRENLQSGHLILI
jgi:Lamin Tail Domain